MKKRQITFYRPSKTLSVSLTGKECMLSCSHCGGHYLEHMTSIEDFINNMAEYTGYKSLLLSGGCNQSGSIDLYPHFDKLKTIIDNGYSLNFHTGLVQNSTLETISELSKKLAHDQKINVSFDFVTDDETIQKVYGIHKTGQDYIDSYTSLQKIANVIPHICIGLLGGKTKGELSALTKLHEIGTRKVVFIIFIPTKNTAFANCTPPDISEIELIFKKSAEIFQDIPVQLGCMRPAGRLRNEIDICALSHGIDHIVMPSKAVIDAAVDMSFEIIYKEECCVL